MENDEDDLDEAIAQKIQLRDLIYQLRGEYISEINEVEEHIDYLIAFYFGNMPSINEFRSLLLSKIQTSKKIDVVGEILRRSGLGEISHRYIQELKAANNFRNELAHSTVGPDPLKAHDESLPLIERILDLSSIRASRSGISATPIAVDDLRDWLGRTCTLLYWTLFLEAGVLACLDGGDALAAVREMEDLNSGVPRLT